VDEISKALFARASQVIPGGVNSPVRAFRAVSSDPIFIREAQGASMVGADGTIYIDYVGSWGPMILGHAHPDVVRAIEQAARRGTSYGAPTAGEIELAEAIIKAVPSIEMVRLTSSGTEAVMGALRVARGFTGRDLVVKFEGCYHGGADYLLVAAGSGAATLGIPDSAGVPASIAATTAVLPFNDVAQLEAFFTARGTEVAAVIVEPVVGNMGCVPPSAEFLSALRVLTEQHNALLVFDEVMTGFRVAYGGAQALYKMRPDLTCLGKIIGGGLPVGAYGGRREIMEKVAPLGPVYQAGTLSGNPLAVAAGLTTLRRLDDRTNYERLEQLGQTLAQGLQEAASRARVEVCVNRVGSMLTLFFCAGPVTCWTDAQRADRTRFAAWHRKMIERGVYWPPSQFEAAFISLAHDETAITKTLEAAQQAF